jgi:hypothetical protein
MPSLVKIGPVVLEKNILKDLTPFLHFLYFLPYEEDQAHCLNKLEFASPKDDLCQV